MGHTPKGRCKKCGKRFKLELKGTEWIIPWHFIRVAGKINPACEGVGKPPRST